MALQHRTAPLTGVQFHPESVMTEGGHRLLANWLVRVGLPGAAERAAGLGPRLASSR
jgi:para-aminobenzoate synthetase component 2